MQHTPPVTARGYALGTNITKTMFFWELQKFKAYIILIVLLKEMIRIKVKNNELFKL